ncbi:endonuclease [soil metagenome]
MRHYFVSRLLLLFIVSASAFSAQAQEKQYKVAAIGFYNLENLFDTINDPNTNDEDFLPEGAYRYTGAIYQDKLSKLSGVISELATDVTPDGVAILGVAEVENITVLEDLVKQPSLAKRGYKIIHHDSPDRRGVDVGLIYQPKYFKVQGSKPLFVQMPLRDDGSPGYTRDILWVWGIFDGELINVFVNHWPSRSGGEAASAPLRDNAAAVCRKVIDSLITANPSVKILTMGDLNDDPTNNSVYNVMQAKGKPEKLKPGELYNPYHAFYKKGLGTLAWNDTWNLFDQIIMSQAWLDKGGSSYHFLRNEVFNRPYLTQQNGNFKGYPHRTYVGGVYQGGYSDHFPVYIFIVKETTK